MIFDPSLSFLNEYNTEQRQYFRIKTQKSKRLQILVVSVFSFTGNYDRKLGQSKPTLYSKEHWKIKVIIEMFACRH